MSTKRIKTILSVLTAIFFISAFFIYKANIAIGAAHKFDDGILNLKFIDNEITFSLNNIYDISNYDKLNADINSFDTNLSNLSMISDEMLLFYQNEIKKDLQNIRDVFSKKVFFLQRSAYVNSSIDSYIQISQYEIQNLALSNKLEPIFYAIKGALMLSPEAIDDISKQIKMYKNEYKDNQKAQNVLDKILYAAQATKTLRTISNSVKELHLDNLIENFRNKILEFHSDEVNKAKIAQRICLLTFIIFCSFGLYQIKMASERLRQIKLLRTTVENDHSSIIYCDKYNRISYVNKTFEEKTGYKLKEVIGKNPRILKSYMHPQSFYESIKEAVQKSLPWESDELISRTKNGNFLYEKVKFSPFFFKNKFEGYIAVKLDRTKETLILNELTQKNEQIKIQSSIDKLTGFGNYFALTEILDAQKDGVLICLSIKNFKILRFFYQTKIIDAMLKAVADTLKLCIDTSEIKAKLFRFQDDAFYMWYEGDNIVRDIEYIREYFGSNRINVAIDEKFENLPGIKMVFGVSLPNDTPQTNRLMQSVLANQLAIENGSNIYYYLENDAIEMKYHKNQLAVQLIEDALENDRVIVEAQGIFNLEENETEAKYYEVLVRIIDQNGKIHYPGEFLDIAMKTQLYPQITKKVISLAFDLAKRYPDYMFSINLSITDIADASMRELIESKLNECKDPNKICFEMLESEELSDYVAVNSFIKRVKGYGCKISIDDFGSGYSNYYRILELDIDTIKIDGSIIKKLPFDENARVLVETIVSFAKKQGYKIVAEFASSEEILNQIKNFGIPYAQGFLLGKPHRME